MFSAAKRILILSAEPKDRGRLRLAEEVRNIQEGLERSLNRESFKIDYHPATRIKDIRRKMLDAQPSIVHFCGHGQGEKGITFENEDGSALNVSAAALARFFENFRDTVECVVLNACYSEVQATAIASYIPFVVGINEAIGDKLAIEFSVAFYDALFAKESYEIAYKLACDSIYMLGAPESLKPTLKVGKETSAWDKALKLVNSGQIMDSLSELEFFSKKGNLSATLILSMIYRDGLGGLCVDDEKAKKYLDAALMLPEANPESWSTLGYRGYKPYQPSLESAAFLTAALGCGFRIPGETCIGAVRIFFKFHCYECVWKYAEYGATKLRDPLCIKIYQKLLREGYPRRGNTPYI